MFFTSEKKRGITQIELLTVIAIISLLAGILIVVVSRVRESALGAKNASNHRQIMQALLSYAASNRGQLPYAADDRSLAGHPETSRGSYPRLLVLGGHINDPSVFFGPRSGQWYRDHMGALANPSVGSWVPWFYTNYGANRYGAMSRVPEDGSRIRLRINQVENPSRIMVLRDVYDGSVGERGGGSVIFARDQYMPPPSQTYGGRVFAAFLDGHVSSFNADELRLSLANDPRSGPPLYENLYTRP